jgi:hypothetical protein
MPERKNSVPVEGAIDLDLVFAEGRAGRKFSPTTLGRHLDQGFSFNRNLGRYLYEQGITTRIPVPLSSFRRLMRWSEEVVRSQDSPKEIQNQRSEDSHLVERITIHEAHTLFALLADNITTVKDVQDHLPTEPHAKIVRYANLLQAFRIPPNATQNEIDERFSCMGEIYLEGTHWIQTKDLTPEEIRERRKTPQMIIAIQQIASEAAIDCRIRERGKTLGTLEHRETYHDVAVQAAVGGIIIKTRFDRITLLTNDGQMSAQIETISPQTRTIYDGDAEERFLDLLQAQTARLLGTNLIHEQAVQNGGKTKLVSPMDINQNVSFGRPYWLSNLSFSVPEDVTVYYRYGIDPGAWLDNSIEIADDAPEQTKRTIEVLGDIAFAFPVQMRGVLEQNIDGSPPRRKGVTIEQYKEAIRQGSILELG